MSTFPGWDTRLLDALGITPNAARRAFLRAWAACEGGNARFNPLNTTEYVPGATVYNGVGVRNFPDSISGLAATMLTLRLPAYHDLLAALGAPKLPAIEIARRGARGLDVWGTGHACVLRKLGG